MTLDGETLYRGTATGALSERLVVSEQVALPLGGAACRSRRRRCSGALR